MCVHVCGVHAPPFPSLPDPDTSKLYGCDGDEVMLLRVWLIVVDQRPPHPPSPQPELLRTRLLLNGSQVSRLSLLPNILA